MKEQRWQSGRSTFCTPKTVFNPSNFGVELIEGDNEAKTFIKAHHYLGTYPSARCRVGLYEHRKHQHARLVGVAVFAHPGNEHVIGAWCQDEQGERLSSRQGVTLGRFILLDELAFNAETWFLARAFRALKATLTELEAVISYSDPLARRNIQGELIFPGHIGTIYQAFNGQYLGLSRAKSLWLDAQGRCIDERLLSKIRGEEQGIQYALETLAKAGLPPRRAHESGRAYLARVMKEGILRRLKHPGNHVYRWGLQHIQDFSPSALTRYPKALNPEQLGMLF